MNESSVDAQKSKQDDDTLSKLPEVLLHHIISFLDIKDAVRTSILSKRWEYLWTSTTNLVFNVSYQQDMSTFMNFVDRALFLRDSPIKEFSIESVKEINPLRLRGWITAVVRRNVEDLSLALSSELAMEFLEVPSCVFTCASLTILSIFTYWTLKFPPSIFLPNLKHLMLELVTIRDAETLKSLISGCPLLETLRLLMCDWQEGQRFHICAPKLWKLIISEDTEIYDRIDCDIMISGPSLKFFDCQGGFLYKYCLYDVPSLEEGYLDVRYEFGEEIDYSTRLYKLLEGFSHVKTLNLSLGALKGLTYQTDLLHNLPFFNNLTYLLLTWMKTEIDCNGLTMILQHCPRLENICFKDGVVLSSHCNTDEGVLEPVPPCFLSHLKIIEINFDQWNKDQKQFVCAVKILLKRAPLLENLILFLPSEGPDVYHMYDCSSDSDDVVDTNVDVDVDVDNADGDGDYEATDMMTLIKKLYKLCITSRVRRIQLTVFIQSGY